METEHTERNAELHAAVASVGMEAILADPVLFGITPGQAKALRKKAEQQADIENAAKELAGALDDESDTESVNEVWGGGRAWSPKQPSRRRRRNTLHPNPLSHPIPSPPSLPVRGYV